MSLRDHGLRVALLGALLDEVGAALAQARADAEEAFAPARADGQTQQLVMLPTGERVGLISIRDGNVSVEFGENDLLKWAAEHVPHQIREVIEPYAWDNDDVIALVAEHFPNLVRREVRSAFRKRAIEEMRGNGGQVIDPATGEGTKLATITRHKPTGAFAYKPDKGGAAQIAAMWRAGGLDSIDVGTLGRPLPLPLPLGGSSDAV